MEILCFDLCAQVPISVSLGEATALSEGVFIISLSLINPAADAELCTLAEFLTQN